VILDPRGGLAGELVQRAAPAPGTGAGKRPPKPVLDAATQAIDRARTDWSKAPKAMMALSRDRSLGARKRRMASDLAWHVVRARRLLDVLVGGDDGASSADLVRAAAILFEGAPFELASAGRDGLEDPRHALLAYVLTTSPDPATALGVATSLPDWFAAELLADHEPEVAVAIARSLLGRAPLALRVHRDRLSRDAALAELGTAGIEATPSPDAPDAVLLAGRPNVHGLSLVQRGDASVQDVGSQRLAARLAPQPGERVLDACAGAGGKTLALASLAPDARILACDVRKDALGRAMQRARAAGTSDRLRFVPIAPQGGLPDAVTGPWDAVLVDAPCTGSGSLRREPHARWSRPPTAVDRMPALQGRILDRFAPLVRPGGRLLYGTCSLFRRENEDVVAAFLERHPDFAPDPAPLRTRPDVDGCDGFFGALLLRMPSVLLFLAAALFALPTAALAANPTPADSAAPALADPDDPVLSALQEELGALTQLLSTDVGSAIADQPLLGEHPAYHLGLQVVEIERIRIIAEEGGLQGWAPQSGRWIHADVRVGEPTLDSTHALRDGSWDDASTGRNLPIGDDVALLRRTIRQEAEVRYRAAVDRYQRVLNDQQVLVGEESSWDLAPVEAHTTLEPLPAATEDDWAVWEDRVRRISTVFSTGDVALDPSVALFVEREVRWFASTDGTVARTAEQRVRLGITADGRAADGTALFEDAYFDAHTLDGLPDEEALTAEAQAVKERLAALIEAPEEPPYQGPALLSGRAAAVFFHEILGHRVEGHRLKQIADAQTFRDKVGEEILPPFLSVIDDPTRSAVGGVDLRGHYAVDDQGVLATPVPVVTDGVLNGFLESRSPVGGERSNGHGRRQAGLAAVTRQGNLIVESSRQLDDDALRAELVSLAKEQGLPYGLVVLDLEGGFTFTDRDIPNAFQIDVRTALRVYVDGRPDELVRGVDLIGTPLQTFSRIVATGDTPAVFNGSCGAESGWVPVSAVAPAMLFSQVESQRKMKGQAPPPLIPPPPGGEVAGDLPALVRLLGAEADRAKELLAIEGGPPVNRIVVEAWDRDAWEVASSFGVLTAQGGGPSRPARVEVVVGDDSVNSLRFDGGTEVELPEAAGNPRFVMDDLPPAVRRDLWLAADGAYRGAVQRLNLKLAELATRPTEKRAPDWASAEPVVAIDRSPPLPIDRKDLELRALALSGAVRSVPGLRSARAAFREVQGVHVMVDTDGMRVMQPDGYASVIIEMEAVRPDGVKISDRLQWTARSLSLLPPVQVMKTQALTAAMALADKAYVGLVGWFEGPVVFEDEAAADLFRYLLPPELRGTPAPLEAGTSTAQQQRREPRLGRRLLPSGWTVVDDPAGTPEGFAGARLIDREGVRGGRVELVDDGYVTELLMTRVPRLDRQVSTGHARGSVSLAPSARMTWWEVAPKRGLSAKAFDRKVAAARKAARVDGVLVVRRLGPGWDGDLPNVVDAVWRFADGTEVPAVALGFEGVDRRTLRQIAAATAAVTVHPYLGPGRAGGYAPATRGVPQGVVAPRAVLVEDMEVAFNADMAEPELLLPVELR